MKILGIDTSNQGLGVALVEDGVVIGNHLGEKSKNHSVSLMPAINQEMKKAGWKPTDLNRIVVASGPGSYTGLRIGVTTAKTLAWTLGIELVSVSSLAAIAANSRDYGGLIIPLFDARRQNIYTGAYQWQSGELVSVIADKHTSLMDWLAELQATGTKELRFVGEDVINFSEAIKTIIPTAECCEEQVLNQVDASSLALLGEDAEPIKDIHGFTPNYLKRVEAEENWLKENQDTVQTYVEKVSYDNDK
ncbi:tRNA (adenosine(37)-N6)-threonylcarbamoyltransferase complex dimerization subunit type 1 TsaB [Vagococcus coleopterorum]|uniref:tRNA (Adenosine(37)-N6)-threonylcarbamoyltransferase complex dimerization subunit type 1 TsaB n=1 Tax=Vagococcus coleopterorum TaxID=2714946 RepID=A0A6G8AN74_9ENTE|nr:tRNA (adenosine(37)-N6)-threonylcarbamoyltransferase complex dimerization subunit type 1 TsaB [Vagococcus coleopterorum]QIL46392.1 tRNA (adenosine(37)-N6)-threonylcarbamoyltransferase complex dimerization subunit type 1 TsaB [Vagococcus coleopterorum]